MTTRTTRLFESIINVTNSVSPQTFLICFPAPFALDALDAAAAAAAANASSSAATAAATAAAITARARPPPSRSRGAAMRAKARRHEASPAKGAQAEHALGWLACPLLNRHVDALENRGGIEALAAVRFIQAELV